MLYNANETDQNEVRRSCTGRDGIQDGSGRFKVRHAEIKRSRMRHFVVEKMRYRHRLGMVLSNLNH